jgi:hypothetical protein
MQQLTIYVNSEHPKTGKAQKLISNNADKIERQCAIKLHELRGGQRHDDWILVNNVKEKKDSLATNS